MDFRQISDLVRLHLLLITRLRSLVFPHTWLCEVKLLAQTAKTQAAILVRSVF